MGAGRFSGPEKYGASLERLEGNAQKKELNAKLAAKTEKIESKDRRIEKLNARIQELKDKNYEIMNTKRYKVASFFAKTFEWFRKRNAEPEEKE